MSLPEKSPQRQHQKNRLASAIASGVSVAAWAKANQVRRRTAFKWANDAQVRKSVEAARQRALDRGIGQMCSRVTWAARRITTLADTAESDAVKLAALKTIFTNMMAVSEFADLRHRVAQLEDQLNEDARARDPGQPS